MTATSAWWGWPKEVLHNKIPLSWYLFIMSAQLDGDKECLWLTDYIYATNLYIDYADACLYIHCLHESILHHFMKAVTCQKCFLFSPITLFCNSEHFSLLFFQGPCQAFIDITDCTTNIPFITSVL